MCRILIASLALVLLVATSAQAAKFVYTGVDQNTETNCFAGNDNAKPAVPLEKRINTQDAFNRFRTRISGDLITEGFESFSTNDSPSSLTFDDNFGNSVVASLACDVATPNCNYLVKSDQTGDTGCVSPNGRFPFTGAKWLDLENNGGFKVEFSEPVPGFGFFASDIGDVEGSLFLECANGVVEEFTVFDQPAQSGASLFWGLIETSSDASTFCKSFTFIKRVGQTVTNDGFGFDDFSVILPSNELSFCNCLNVNYVGTGCPNVSTVGDKCTCIKWFSDPSQPPCTTFTEVCDE